MFSEIIPSRLQNSSIVEENVNVNDNSAFYYYKCIRYLIFLIVLALTVSVFFKYTFSGIYIVLIVLSILLIMINCYICMKG